MVRADRDPLAERLPPAHRANAEGYALLVTFRLETPHPADTHSGVGQLARESDVDALPLGPGIRSDTFDELAADLRMVLLTSG